MFKASALAALLLAILASCVSAEPIDECGQIGPVLSGCHFFHPLRGGGSYKIELAVFPDSALYSPVRVIGEIVPLAESCGYLQIHEHIVNPTILPCLREDLGCGVLAGTNDWDDCYVWRSPIHGVLELHSLHGFSTGDTVEVTGVVDRISASTCMVGEGFLKLEEFSPCDSITAATRLSWGTVKALFGQ
jgi:hypothetical protein